MSWWQIKVRAFSEEVKDATGSFFFDQGAIGVSEIKEAGVTYVLGCFTSPTTEIEKSLQLFLGAQRELSPQEEISFTTERVLEDNWSDKYKEFYQAQPLTHRFYLKPAWDLKTEVPPGMIPLILDPGQAFGTGLHPSTKLTLRLMEQGVGQYSDLSKVRLIDVGTGTGILAMAAKHLGFGDITAIDIDPISVEVANENFEKNGVQGIKLSTKNLAEFKEPFDVILSNILLETHRELVTEYKRLLKDGGQLILSGLLGGQRRWLEEILKPYGFIGIGSCSLQEWAAYVYTYRENP